MGGSQSKPLFPTTILGRFDLLIQVRFAVKSPSSPLPSTVPTPWRPPCWKGRTEAPTNGGTKTRAFIGGRKPTHPIQSMGMVYLPTFYYMNGWLFVVNVGKYVYIYISYMDAMGMVYYLLTKWDDPPSIWGFYWLDMLEHVEYSLWNMLDIHVWIDFGLSKWVSSSPAQIWTTKKWCAHQMENIILANKGKQKRSLKPQVSFLFEVRCKENKLTFEITTFGQWSLSGHSSWSNTPLAKV